MFQSNQPDVVSRSLVGQCLYLVVETGPTHIQQVAEHVDVEAWVVHIVFDALLTVAMNFQSKSLEQLMQSVLFFSSFRSRLAYLWRNSVRLVKQVGNVLPAIYRY